MFPGSNSHIFISTDYIEKCQPDIFALFPQCKNLPIGLFITPVFLQNIIIRYVQFIVS